MFGAILGAVAPALIGGIFNSKTNSQNSANSDRSLAMQVKYNREDRDNERAFQIKQRENDRQYMAGLTKEERAYMEGRVSEQRQYDRDYNSELTQSDRDYADQTRSDQRNYDQAQVADERAYSERNRAADQELLDIKAQESAATRGVDLKKLRDQAVAAGFNPLSVLGMAGMYSTEVNGTVAARGGSSSAVGSGSGVGGGGSHSGQTAPSFVQGGGGGVGGVSTAGMGGNYQRQFQPALSSGGFIAEAVQRGLDTAFNTPVGSDPLAEALKNAMNTDTIVKSAQATNYRQPFGYSLTDQAPYIPSVSRGGPPIPAAGAMPGSPGPSPSDEMVTPSKNPIMMGGTQLKPSGHWSDTAPVEERYGEVAGELHGLPSYIWDMTDHVGKSARGLFDRAWAGRHTPQAPVRRPPLKPGYSMPDGYGGFYH